MKGGAVREERSPLKEAIDYKSKCQRSISKGRWDMFRNIIFFSCKKMYSINLSPPHLQERRPGTPTASGDTRPLIFWARHCLGIRFDKHKTKIAK